MSWLCPCLSLILCILKEWIKTVHIILNTLPPYGACNFWATVCKTVHPMLSDCCLSCLSVCDVGVLWPNGWMDQDETRRVGRPRPWPHCVRWGPSSPSSKGGPQFSAHICCSHMAGWINMPLGMEVGLSPGDFVLDGDPAPPEKKGTTPPNYFWPKSIAAKRLDGSRCHLVLRQASSQATLC